jgi:hypothetical protein
LEQGGLSGRHTSMIRKSGYRFSETIMLEQTMERDDEVTALQIHNKT